MLLIVFGFERGIRVAHCFLFWMGYPCCSWFFVLGGGSVLLIVFYFGSGIRVAHRFLLWEEDPCHKTEEHKFPPKAKNDEQHGSHSQNKKR